jgi:hypothetical protein
MKIRFMCLKHYCDLEIDGQKDNGTLRVDTPVLMDNGDGTYEFDFSEFSCPEQDVYQNQAIQTINAEEEMYKQVQNIPELQDSIVQYTETYWDDLRQQVFDEDEYQCGSTWTAVMYSNFTKIGDDEQRYTYNKDSKNCITPVVSKNCPHTKEDQRIRRTDTKNILWCAGCGDEL